MRFVGVDNDVVETAEADDIFRTPDWVSSASCCDVKIKGADFIKGAGAEKRNHVNFNSFQFSRSKDKLFDIGQIRRGNDVMWWLTGVGRLI